MKIVKRHFDGKPTYVVGAYISNGCQTFHVDNAQNVFNRFRVPIKMQEEVLSYVNRDEDLTPYINHQDWRVRVLVAKQGYGLDVLVKDEMAMVRLEVAEQGYRLYTLVMDEKWVVRREAKRQLLNSIKRILNIFKKKTT